MVMRRLSALLATGVLVALVALALSSCGGGASGAGSSGGGEHQQAKIRGCVPECLYQGTGLRPFVVDRNIRHFVWYGGVAGEGLRSVGEEALPSSKSVCSILPIVRHLRAGVSFGVSRLYVWRPRRRATY